MSATKHVRGSSGRRRLERWIGLLALVLVTLLPGCTSSRPAAEAVVLPPAQTYLRTAGDGTQARELQIAIRRFSSRQGRGAELWLVGVSHIGEPAYYQQLQQLLDKSDIVLYEGVGMKPRTEKVASQPVPNDPLHRDALNQSLQGTLARSLGLVFQLTSIDYSRSHFRNSDLTRADLEKLISAPDPDTAGQQPPPSDEKSNEAEEQFAMLMQAMEEGSWLNSMAKFLLNFIESSPQMRGLARLAMIELLGGVGGDFEALAKVNPGMEGLLKVLVDARNAKVMEDLAGLLKRHRSHTSIAIFYGAAHMKDFEGRLSQQFDYVAREERWLTAFGVDFKKSGIGTAEQSMIRSMIQWQLESLKSRD